MSEPKQRVCQNCKASFTIDASDFKFYDKVKVPPPTWCPECRLRRRMVFRNEHFLYKRKDTRTGELVFSTLPPEAPVKVYERDYWWSDNWNPMEYGRAIDWDRPFLEQFKELTREVPWFSRSVINLVNSDYSANASDLKNCYLIFNSNRNEDCAYGVGLHKSKDCLDNYELDLSELCHQCFMVKRSYRIFFSSHCQDCQDIYFSKDLAHCQNCLGCIGLRNKQYHIFNKPFSKEEYAEKLKEFEIGSYKNTQELQKKAKDLWLHFPHKFMHGIKNINVKGDYINYSRNIFDSFLINGGEDCRYCVSLDTAPVKDCYDYCFWGLNAELVYDSTQVGLGVSRLKFCLLCYPDCRDLQYCLMCHSSADLFGCVGLRNKQYCILNKQYSKEQYGELVPKIIQYMNEMPYISRKSEIPNPKSSPAQIFKENLGGQANPNDQNSKSQTREIVYRYGEFFPPELSPFSYNETIAQEYFPLTKEEAIKQGYTWKDPEERDIKPTIKAQDLPAGQAGLPDHIKDVSDSITSEVIECANAKSQILNSKQIPNSKSKIPNTEFSQCTQAFRIILKELEFYRKMNLPLPRYCPNCRHYARIQQRNPLRLWHRPCQCAGPQSSNGVYKNTTEHFHGTHPCPNEFETTYSPDRKEIVYCEKCYQSEVV